MCKKKNLRNAILNEIFFLKCSFDESILVSVCIPLYIKVLRKFHSGIFDFRIYLRKTREVIKEQRRLKEREREREREQERFHNGKNIVKKKNMTMATVRSIVPPQKNDRRQWCG